MITKYKTKQKRTFGREFCARCGEPITWVNFTGKYLPLEKKTTLTYTKDGGRQYGHLPHWKTCRNKIDKEK